MVWAVKYSKKFQRMGVTKTYRVDILSEAGGGVITPDKMGANPLQVKTLGAERGEDKIVIGSEITFEFVLLRRTGEANYNALFQSEYMEHVVKYYDDDTSTLLWQGFLQPENMYKSMFERNLHIFLSATDGLKDLSEFSFLNGTSIITGHLSGLQILKYCLTNLDIGSQFQYNFIIKLGTKPDGWAEGDDNALEHVTHDTRRFVNSVSGRTNIDDCLTVIEKVLRPYSCTLQQWGGKYYILSKHEAATNYYTYNWALAFQSKAASSDLVNIDAYKFQREADVSYISPIKEVGIRLLNKNVGSPLVADINDYTEATGPWDYSNYTWFYDAGLGDYMELNAKQDAGAPGVSNGYITLLADVAIQKLTEGDYLKIRFNYRHTTDGVANPEWPQFKVTAVKDGVDYESVLMNIMNGYLYYESPENDTFKLVGNIGQTFNYNFKIEIISNDTVNFYDINLTDFDFTRIFTAVGDDLSGVTFDMFYRGMSAKGKIKLPVVDFYFGDTVPAADFAALVYSGNNTDEWDREGVNDNALLLYLWAKNMLTARQDYMEYIVCVIKDSGDNITPVNYIQFDGKTYHIVSYDKSPRSSWISLHLKQWVTTALAITWEAQNLTSINGVST